MILHANCLKLVPFTSVPLFYRCQRVCPRDGLTPPYNSPSCSILMFQVVTVEDVLLWPGIGN